MFGVGFWELTLVFVIAIVVINPKDLPKIIYNIGFYCSKIQQSLINIKNNYLQDNIITPNINNEHDDLNHKYEKNKVK